jgi:serine/threonine-protein kinase
MVQDSLIGQHLGVYLIQSKLGEGGMARVYKAYHSRLRRDVAIKIILPQIVDSEGFRLRFEREAQLIASLDHPNIVAVYDFGDIGNITYLVMQYVGGGTLRDRLRGQQVLEPQQATRYAIQMAKALHHAHLRGIVHRDVKPQNMLISTTDPNHLLLSDFGIAKLFDARMEPTLVSTGPISPMSGDSGLTRADQIVGTADYMAPEQVNAKPVDARTDVYALGVVLFQMLTGETPFRSTTIQGLLFQHVYTPPPPLHTINPYVPEILEQIVAKALAKAPEDRFQSAEEMAQALEFANAHSTHRLSSSLPGTPISTNYPEGGAQTSPSMNRQASLYTQQSSVSAPGAASGYGSQGQSAFSATPPFGVPAPQTHPGITSPSLARPTRKFPLSYLALIVLAAVLIIGSLKIIPLFTSSGGPTTSSTATSFTDTFQNNDHNWPQGSLNGLTASISNGSYMLQTDSSNQTYFPHPDVGTLPNNFTLTVQMQQQSGAGAFYGLAFRFSQNGSNISCYAFIINAEGKYQLLKYDPAAPNQYHTIWSNNQSWPSIHGLNQSNTLQAVVFGNTFSFKVNGQDIPLGTTPTSTSYTDNSSPYTGGQLALLISGPNTSFLVTSVQLQAQ